MQTVDAIIDSAGNIRLVGGIRLPKNRRAKITILDEEAGTEETPKTRIIDHPLTGYPVLDSGPDAPVLTSEMVAELLSDFP